MKSKFYHCRALFIILLSIILTNQSATAVAQDIPHPNFDNQCSDVSYMMAHNKTPYDFELGGGSLAPLATTATTMAVDHYADFWSFQVSLDTSITFEFDEGNGDLLEFALFRGMVWLDEAFRPLVRGASITYRVQPGTYTMVVRRTHIASQEAASYSIRLNAVDGGLGTATNGEVVKSNGQPYNQQAQVNNGIASLKVDAASASVNYRFHPGSINQVNDGRQQGTQVYFWDDTFSDRSAYNLFTGLWTKNMSFLAGDLAVNNLSDRIFFLQNFAWEDHLTGGAGYLQLNDLTFKDGTRITLKSPALFGVWLTDNCAGFKLRDGRSFISAIQPQERFLSVQGDIDKFEIRLNANDASGELVLHVINMNWNGIREESQISLLGSVLSIFYVANREFHAQTTDISLLSHPPEPDKPGLLEANLRNRDSQITLDWVNIRVFSLVTDFITLEFLDARGSTPTTRSGAYLDFFKSLEDENHENVIQIRYKTGVAGQDTYERLMLPASESYLEIITPSASPPFDGRALPDEAGFRPRTLNNLGGECYPLTDILPEANCPANGNPNPANGNLWYSVTDAVAYGNWLNLSLTRNYNSRDIHSTGPFGQGWTTEYLLDYNVPYSTETLSRQIVPNVPYRVGLDVTYAPRGIVNFITASGSQHQFVSMDDPYQGSSTPLRSITMPGWTLTHRSVGARTWLLQQDTGQSFEFDRAGRLIRSGYPQYGRMIEIAYPRSNLNGPGSLGDVTPVIITDKSAEGGLLRQLELYYNADHFISRSILRDMQVAGANASLSECEAAKNCFETHYHYESGKLVAVDYYDGETATYAYDAAGRMTEHSDPFAPVAPHMIYTYDSRGNIHNLTINPVSGEPILWRSLNYTLSTTTRVASVKDNLGNTRDYTYALTNDSLKRRITETWESTYILIQQTSPLAGAAGADPIESSPVTYIWSSVIPGGLDYPGNSMLTKINARVSENSQEGRSSVDFRYTPTGQLYCIACVVNGLPSLRITFTNDGDPSDSIVPVDGYQIEKISFSDSSSLRYTYTQDEHHLIEEFVDRDGGIYRYRWSEGIPVRLEQVESLDDGTIWYYSYNGIGLLTQIVEQRAGEDLAGAYTLKYEWDGLGRLTDINDSLLGNFHIAYPLPRPSDAGIYFTDIELTDPIGSKTISRFDTAGRLVETRLQDQTGYIRRKTYRYDAQGRLLIEEQWVADRDGSRPLQTFYRYTPQPVLDLANLTPSGRQITINGYRVDVTDPAGKQRRYIFDALNRLRETFDEKQRSAYYEYSTTDTENDFGLRITNYERLSGILAPNINSFRFDSRWQLSSLERLDPQNPERVLERFDVTFDNDSTRIKSLRAATEGRTILREVLWDGVDNYLPASIRVRQVSLDMNSRYNIDSQNVPRLNLDYDFKGRPLFIKDGADVEHSIAYCPQPAGLVKTVYGAANTPVSCESTVFDVVVITDVHGRVYEYRDISGTRRMTYSAQPDSIQWLVTVTFTHTNNQQDTWKLHYNAAGDLIQWDDQSGITHSYTYDALGRLCQVLVQNQPRGADELSGPPCEADMSANPEESFKFTYNDASRLTEIVDGLGRGYLYNFNEAGQVISQLNMNTADAVSFDYTPTGQLSSVISPLGTSTTLIYDDPANPTRLTRLIEPTGNQHVFEWRDRENRLVYTDPLQRRTTYQYDGMGLLWSIQDSLPVVQVPQDTSQNIYRSHEFRYDSDGWLSGWLSDVSKNGSVSQQFVIENQNETSFTVYEQSEGQSRWSQTLNFAPSGQLLSTDGVKFKYDALERLNQVESGALAWKLGWQPGKAEVVLSDPYQVQVITHFDALFRSISETTGDTTSTYTYMPDRTGAVILEMNRPGQGMRHYTISPGSARLSTPPMIRLESFGQSVEYVFDVQGLLLRIQTNLCTDKQVADIDDCPPETPVFVTTLRFEYDADQRPIRVIDEDGNARTFAYDDADNLITYQTAGGQTFNYTYDTANRLVSVTTATGVRLLLRYDPLDNLTGICRTRVSQQINRDFQRAYQDCVTSANTETGEGLIEEYAYNRLNQLVARSFPDNGGISTQQLEYDNHGNLRNLGRMSLGYDAIDRVSQISTGQNYRFDYAGLNRLVEAGNLTFSYDNLGRISTYKSGNRQFTLNYADNGYIVGDQTGSSLHYELYPDGYLQGISFRDSNRIALGYRLNDEPFGSIMFWNNKTPGEDSAIITGLFTQGESIQSQTFTGAGDMSLFYDTDASGQVRRQNITRLPGRSDGYIVVQGYDNDARSLTMRVTDTNGLQVLYTQTLTYNTAGLRTGEQLQYADGTRVLKELAYQDLNQLVVQTITIIRPAAAVAPMLLVPMITFMGKRRKRILIAAFLLLCIGLPLHSQDIALRQNEERYEFHYEYDTQGNLKSIRLKNPATVCASFQYDNANRLKQIDREGMDAVNYDYDAYNRISSLKDSAGNIQIFYQGDNNRVLAVSSSEGMVYFGQTGELPPFFAVNQDGDTTWLMTDGRYRIYQTYQDGDDPRKELWLFDTLGRYLPLTSPAAADTLNPCMLNGFPEIQDNLRLQSLSNGELWDAAAGLYFHNGRAFDAETGRYLQRDPAGPDILGNVYEGPQRQTAPVVQQQTPVYAGGIQVLRRALDIVSLNEQLDANTVKAHYMPVGAMTVDPFVDMMREARQPFDTALNNLATLPVWLQSNYNLPAPTVNMQTGQLVLSNAAAPGQGGRKTPFTASFNRTLPYWLDLTADSIVTPQQYLAPLIQSSASPLLQHLRMYQPQSWQPSLPGLLDTLEAPLPPVDVMDTPEAVLARLPRPLTNPAQAAYALGLVQALYDMPNKPAYTWINDALNQALPKKPFLPPGSITEWYGEWFSNDWAGLEKSLIPQLPSMPVIPVYESGDNSAWLQMR